MFVVCSCGRRRDSSRGRRLTGLIDIGNAKIAGMEKDLKLSSDQFEWLIWAFYITYIGFEWMTLMSVSANHSLRQC